MMRLPILTAALALLLLFTSCRRANNPSRPPLSDERFRSVYIALLEEGERLRSLPAGSSKQPYADSIFRAFKTTATEFQATVETYRVDPKKWQVFFERVVKDLEEKQKQPTPKPAL